MWLRPKIESWVQGVNKLAAIATRFPHSAYVGLVSCLATEWQYACRVIPDIGPLLAPIKHAIRTTFLPAVIGPNIEIDDDLQNLLALGVKSGGLAIRDPTTQAESLYRSSRDATTYLSESLLHNEPINTHHHKSTDHFAGTELTRHEWLDNIALWYGSRPPHLPSRCDGCGEGFTVELALNCKKGGLVGIHHDDARNKWAHLCSLAFTNARVVIEPTILYGNDSATGPSRDAMPNSPPPPNDAPGDESRGDVLVHCFWQCARGTIFDVRICDTDARSYANTSSDKVATQTPDPTPTPPPTKCWSAPPRRRSGSMSRPASPNVETLLHLSTQWTDLPPRTPATLSADSPASLPQSGTGPTPTWRTSSGPG
ncbi:hypothetical protein ACHAW6_004462 [Cyclotella cf. meneghiniana]